MQNSGVPRARQYPEPLTPSAKDMDAFLFLQEIKVDVVNFVKNGENLYIYSTNFGNGKTSWAIKILLKWFDEVWAGNGFRCRGLFVHVPTFLSKCKEFTKKDEDFDTMKDRLAVADLVVWDDIASTNLSSFDHTNLLTFIDQRSLQGLANIYTGNLSEAGLEEALGNRLKSRVWNDSISVEFVGTDRRGMR